MTAICIDKNIVLLIHETVQNLWKFKPTNINETTKYHSEILGTWVWIKSLHTDNLNLITSIIYIIVTAKIPWNPVLLEHSLDFWEWQHKFHNSLLFALDFFPASMKLHVIHFASGKKHSIIWFISISKATKKNVVYWIQNASKPAQKSDKQFIRR